MNLTDSRCGQVMAILWTLLGTDFHFMKPSISSVRFLSLLCNVLSFFALVAQEEVGVAVAWPSCHLCLFYLLDY